jgi:hypothetical protein
MNNGQTTHPRRRCIHDKSQVEKITRAGEKVVCALVVLGAKARVAMQENNVCLLNRGKKEVAKTRKAPGTSDFRKYWLWYRQ